MEQGSQVVAVGNQSSHDKFIHYDGWPYPSWFFSTARWNPGGPTWYGDISYRTPAWLYAERSIIEILTIIIILVLMFLMIFPIIKYRLNSTITALNTIGIGMTIALCMVMPEWLSGSTEFESVLDHLSLQRYSMKVGVHIGLSSFNVTLDYLSELPENVSLDSPSSLVSAGNFWYNEKISTYHPDDLVPVMGNSLRRGMPSPLITVIHFLTASTLGFEWPHRVGEAGFHVYIILLFALLGWFGAVLLTACIPRYSSYAFIAVGVLMVAATLIYFYWAMIDLVFPCIVIEDNFVQVKYGACYWTCLGVGVWSIIYGFTLATFDITHPDSFLTIFDIDYDEKRTLARANRLNLFAPISNAPYRD
ncbi:unnamed protein product [Allacma fusca]|uniref:Dual oxidase maturation factor 1 n=1 Tax=Allacma fusca TaxID=39272 RepID=A0A8J2PPW1_9HEXA|nr:unnamed protein product [Allacma fusca]